MAKKNVIMKSKYSPVSYEDMDIFLYNVSVQGSGRRFRACTMDHRKHELSSELKEMIASYQFSNLYAFQQLRSLVVLGLGLAVI